MANKISVELSANVTGFQQGMNQASESCEKYQTETRKISDATGNFRKELAQAKKDVMNLAQAYSKLDATTKASQFGKEMAAQLDAAKQKASEMIDMQGDLNQELKNMASDTRVFDTMTEGMGVFLSVASTASGVIAQFTGDEEDAKRAVVMFTTAQSALTAATKIQNALQKQSNLMLAVSKVQRLASTAAVNLETAAKSKNIVVTKAATVAQAAFNTVAKANPYVLLATAIIAVTAAVGAYIISTRKSTEEQAKAAKATEQLKQKQEAMKNALGDSIPTFMRLQAEWRTLRTENEKTQWIEKNKSEFEKLGVAVNNVSDAENVLVNNSSAVVKAILLRAEAAAKAQIVIENYKKTYEAINKLEGFKGKKIDADQVQDLIDSGVNPKFIKQTGGWNRFNREYEVEVERAERDMKMSWVLNSEKLHKEAAEELQKANDIIAEKGMKAAGTTSKKLTAASKDASKNYVESSLEYAENKLKEFQEKLKNADVNDTTLINNIKKQIDYWQKEVDSRKIKIGMEVKESDKAKTAKEILSAHEQLLKKEEEEAEAALVLATLHHKSVEEIDKLIQNWEKAKQARKDYESVKTMATTGPTVTGDKDYSKAMHGNLKSYNELSEAASTLEKKMKTLDLTIPADKSQYDAIAKRLTDIKEKMQSLNKTFEEDTMSAYDKYLAKMDKLEQKMSEQQKVIDATSRSFSALGSIFKQTGDDGAAAMMEVTAAVLDGVAQMIPQILTLVAAKEGEALASGTASAAEMPYPANIAAIATIIATCLSTFATIASVISSYDQGGIIGGNKYHGDRILARVESGEMILNKRQQRNLFNLLDTDIMPQRSGTHVQVEGVIRGSDLMLVQKNTNRIKSRTGTQIHF